MVSNFFGTPCISRCLWFQQRLQPDWEFFLVTSSFITHLQCRARLWWTLLTQTWKEFHLMPILWNKHCSPVGLGNSHINAMNLILIWFCRLISALSRSHCVGCAAEDAGEPPRSTRLSTRMICSLAFSLWLAKKWLATSPRCPNQPSSPPPPTTLLAFSFFLFFFLYIRPHLFMCCWLTAWQ